MKIKTFHVKSRHAAAIIIRQGVNFFVSVLFLLTFVWGEGILTGYEKA
ncbi:MAG: hypothetical protein Q4F35_00070 [Akkermansia sp.]|nr:hypothetical protein [Akkermansia sp.]